MVKNLIEHDEQNKQSSDKEAAGKSNENQSSDSQSDVSVKTVAQESTDGEPGNAVHRTSPASGSITNPIVDLTQSSSVDHLGDQDEANNAVTTEDSKEHQDASQAEVNKETSDNAKSEDKQEGAASTVPPVNPIPDGSPLFEFLSQHNQHVDEHPYCNFSSALLLGAIAVGCAMLSSSM